MSTFTKNFLKEPRELDIKTGVNNEVSPGLFGAVKVLSSPQTQPGSEVYSNPRPRSPSWRRLRGPARPPWRGSSAAPLSGTTAPRDEGRWDPLLRLPPNLRTAGSPFISIHFINDGGSFHLGERFQKLFSFVCSHLYERLSCSLGCRWGLALRRDRRMQWNRFITHAATTHTHTHTPTLNPAGKSLREHSCWKSKCWDWFYCLFI